MISRPCVSQDGIEQSACVVVFITQSYLLKASGDGPNGLDDNVKFEFDHALRRRGVRRMVSAVMEPSCSNPREWRGVVNGKLGGLLYANLTADASEQPERWAEGIAQLERDIRETIAAEGEQVAPPPPTAASAAAAEAEAASSAASVAVSAPTSAVAAPTAAPSSASASDASASGAAPPPPDAPRPLKRTASDALEERALKRPSGAGASAEERAAGLGIDAIFHRAGIKLDTARRDAVLAFCDAQEVAESLTEIAISDDAVDDLMRTLQLPSSREARLRKALGAHYDASLPWYERAWRWVKGSTTKEVE